jgi:hypothetical protein
MISTLPISAPRTAPQMPTTPSTPPELPGASPSIDPYDPAVIRARVEAGQRAENTEDTLPPGLGGKPAPTYFRTYEQMKSALYALEQKYPNLVEIRDIGDSAEKIAGKADRDVLAIVLSNKQVAGEKPSTMHVGGIHAREIANPELLMKYATDLLAGFGSDPLATMVLNDRETVIVPILNPDGHAVVERGFAGEPDGNTMQRKSTRGGDPRVGTDLNRNFDFHWGGPGASTSPTNETYRGPSAASEPETQAVQKYLAEHKTSFFMDWHSYSQLNLYPWGDTEQHTKDHAGFSAMAKKMTTFNGYSPIQSIDLYPTTGTTDDFAYGRLGVPGMTVESGTSFLQSDKEFQKTLELNLPVLDYVVRAADAPFQRVFGPDASKFTIDAASHRVNASLSDASNGGQAISAAELVLDAKAAPGSGIALQAADGKFDSKDEAVVGDVSSLPAVADAKTAAGTLAYIRGRDADGNWGPLTPQWLTAPTAG